MASGSQIESGTAIRPRCHVIGVEVCAVEVCAAFAAMALPVDDADGYFQDRATLPMCGCARHDRVMMMFMIPMAESLPDVPLWIRGNGLEIPVSYTHLTLPTIYSV